MKYLFDTNVCIELLRDSKCTVANRLAEVPNTDIALSSVVKAELYHGAFKSARLSHHINLIDGLYASIRVLPFDNSCALEYGRIKSALERDGTPIGPLDMLIAATAVANNLVLVTHNVREFSRVPGLVIEDWQGP